MKKPFERRMRSWEDNIQMDLKDIVCEGVEWIRQAQDRVQWRALVNTVKGEEFLDYLSNYQLLKEGFYFMGGCPPTIGCPNFALSSVETERTMCPDLCRGAATCIRLAQLYE
jgi:hypothetical protein